MKALFVVHTPENLNDPNDSFSLLKQELINKEFSNSVISFSEFMEADLDEFNDVDMVIRDVMPTPP